MLLLSRAFPQQVAVEVNPSGTIQEVEGKAYFFHHVKAGQTLYSIARAYTVMQDVILAENADLVYGLKTGQVIRIPAFLHHVAPRETAYGISRMYGLTTEQLFAHNPYVAAEGLKPGQVLYIPGRDPRDELPERQVSAATERYEKNYVMDMPADPPPLTRDDSVMMGAVKLKPAATIFDGHIPCPQADLKSVYHVALLIPLFLNELPVQAYADSMTFLPEFEATLKNRSFSFLPYYHGVLLALDSIRNQGVDVRLHVFDVGQEEDKARDVVARAGFSRMDLIIGPFYPRSLDYIANYAKANNIPVVSPLLADKQQLRGFPNLFKATPSLEVQLDGLSRFLAKKYPRQNIVIVHNNQPQALHVINGFRASLINDFKASQGLAHRADSTHVLPSNIHEVIYNREGMSGLLSKLKHQHQNVIVTLIGGEAFLSNYLRELNLQARQYQLVLFGIPDWKDYQSLEIDYLQNLNVHIFSPDFYDYAESHIQDFVLKYRQFFLTEPENDAFKGAQTAYFFFKALALYGRHFPECMSQFGVFDKAGQPYHYTRPYGDSGGWENDRSTLFKYQDFRMIHVEQ